MGKITRALEKAKKGNVAMPARPSTMEPAPSAEVPSEPTIAHAPGHRMEKGETNDHVRPEMEQPDPPVDANENEMDDENRISDTVNLALLKPVAPEPSRPPQSLNRQPEVRPAESESSGGVRQTESKKRVKVRYSRTKVQHSDPEKLKNNLVLSIFENFETTNQFKILRTQVLRKLKAIGGNSILITSANPCEGKTFTSINLGISIAKEFDRTVLIIDADIRRPLKQHTDFSTEFFSLNVEKGLTDYLEGEADIEDILINPGIDKLTLIPGGMPVDNAPELLNSGRMEEMMLEIKSRYPSDRLVILDGPAILHYPDAMILYRYVDGVLPVIEAERTSAENVKKMMEYLQEVNILGLVLNKNKG
jgi:protein-tyrosine kinase